MRTPPKRILKRPRDPVSDRASFPYGPDVDLALASRLARVVAIIGVAGRPTPLVEPIGDRAGFDRELCGAGVKRFARERFDSDWPGGHSTRPHVLVEELAPGCRHRSELLVVMNHEMN